MKKQINHLTAGELRAKLDAGEIKQHEVLDIYWNEIEKINPRINSIVTLCKDQPAPSPPSPPAASPLAGIPVTIKDHFATKGIRTTNGARAFSDFIPDYDASVVRKRKKMSKTQEIL